MDNRVNSWLEDVERSIDEIFEFLPEQRDFLVYQKDLKTKKSSRTKYRNNRGSY